MCYNFLYIKDSTLYNSIYSSTNAEFVATLFAYT